MRGDVDDANEFVALVKNVQGAASVIHGDAAEVGKQGGGANAVSVAAGPAACAAAAGERCHGLRRNVEHAHNGAVANVRAVGAVDGDLAP